MAEAVQHSESPWWATDRGVRNRDGYICHTNDVQHYPGQDERFKHEKAQREADKLLMAGGPVLLDASIRAAGSLSACVTMLRELGRLSTANLVQVYHDALVEAIDELMLLESRGRIMPIGREWDAARNALQKAKELLP